MKFLVTLMAVATLVAADVSHVVNSNGPYQYMAPSFHGQQQQQRRNTAAHSYSTNKGSYSIVPSVESILPSVPIASFSLKQNGHAQNFLGRGNQQQVSYASPSLGPVFQTYSRPAQHFVKQQQHQTQESQNIQQFTSGQTQLRQLATQAPVQFQSLNLHKSSIGVQRQAQKIYAAPLQVQQQHHLQPQQSQQIQQIQQTVSDRIVEQKNNAVPQQHIQQAYSARLQVAPVNSAQQSQVQQNFYQPQQIQQSYSAPQQVQQSYSAPQQVQQTYSAPQQTYLAAQQVQQSYSAPQQVQQTYSAPQQVPQTYSPNASEQNVNVLPQQQAVLSNSAQIQQDLQSYLPPQKIQQDQQNQQIQQSYSAPQQVQQTYSAPTQVPQTYSPNASEQSVNVVPQHQAALSNSAQIPQDLQSYLPPQKIQQDQQNQQIQQSYSAPQQVQQTYSAPQQVPQTYSPNASEQSVNVVPQHQAAISNSAQIQQDLQSYLPPKKIQQDQQNQQIQQSYSAPQQVQQTYSAPQQVPQTYSPNASEQTVNVVPQHQAALSNSAQMQQDLQSYLSPQQIQQDQQNQQIQQVQPANVGEQNVNVVSQTQIENTFSAPAQVEQLVAVPNSNSAPQQVQQTDSADASEQIMNVLPQQQPLQVEQLNSPKVQQDLQSYLPPQQIQQTFAPASQLPVQQTYSVPAAQPETLQVTQAAATQAAAVQPAFSLSAQNPYSSGYSYTLPTQTLKYPQQQQQQQFYSAPVQQFLPTFQQSADAPIQQSYSLPASLPLNYASQQTFSGQQPVAFESFGTEQQQLGGFNYAAPLQPVFSTQSQYQQAFSSPIQQTYAIPQTSHSALNYFSPAPIQQTYTVSAAPLQHHFSKQQTFNVAPTEIQQNYALPIQQAPTLIQTQSPTIAAASTLQYNGAPAIEVSSSTEQSEIAASMDTNNSPDPAAPNAAEESEEGSSAAAESSPLEALTSSSTAAENAPTQNIAKTFRRY